MFCVVQDLMWDFAQIVTGWDLSKEKWCTEQGRRIVTLQRALLLLGGPDVYWDPDKDDDNPPRFYEPLPSGPLKGQTTDKQKVATDKEAYYISIGWDKRGIPTSDTLKRLGLNNLENVFDKMQ